MVEVYIVLDIGKTNVKLTALDGGAQVHAEARRPNSAVSLLPYRQHDVERIWHWMLDTLREWAGRFDVRAIVPVTHGATAALVDDDGLVLPVLDYEVELLHDAGYEAVRPPFSATCSPALPAGLNLGRQLHWLQQTQGEKFRRACHILMYPQYWAWRLSGVAAGELTSLGCHTDLWEPHARTYSSVVAAMQWKRLMPPLQPAGAVLGCLLPEVVQRTGLRADCRVVCGIHDSNASLLRHLGGSGKIVLSTGTWVIAAAVNAAVQSLDERLDMLANVSANGSPVSCMRFMGGREFGVLAGFETQVCSEADLARVIDGGTLAAPSFAAIGGPFPGRLGRISGPEPRNTAERYALATVYCALMTDYCLEHLDPAAPVVVEGSFTANPYFARLLAALRPGRVVSVSDDASGTTSGGWMLATGKALPSGPAAQAVSALQLPGLAAYAKQWRAICVAPKDTL
ncbi:FGGY-family carbohydrate kinase [Duganella hordei]|uniref:FGGY-family carbohydrate kinase n=1 Tax=Duganella hordei TaxID=2865934 RepID=UPI00333EAB23